MKINHAYFYCLFLCAGSCLGLNSCIVFSEPPYTVDLSRQKQNLYYVASTPNTPLLTEKNEISINTMFTAGSNYNGMEIQASYLPLDHLGIMGSYSYAEKYSRFELGSGYETKLTEIWNFETYAGIGTGQINNQHQTGTSKLNLTHFFLQPAFVVSNKNKTAQLGFVSRFEGVNFKVSDTSFSNDREPFSTRNIKSLYEEPFHIMWQPGIAFRLGWESFLFHAGYSYSADLTNPDLHRGAGNFSLGLSLRLKGGKEITINEK